VKTISPFLRVTAILFVYWLILFDFQRVVFSLMHFDVFTKGGWEYVGIFFYSLRLDFATAAFLSASLVLSFFVLSHVHNRWTKLLFYVLLGLETFFVSVVHSAEINAYFEWNHKLTSRVFMHLSNPDEVMRTADIKSTILFFIFLIVELTMAFLIYRRILHKRIGHLKFENSWWRTSLLTLTTALLLGISLLLARGGWQQIPINIDAAYYSKNQKLNDLSVNSAYFFGNSYFLFLKTDFKDILPTIAPKVAEKTSNSLFTFDRNHSNYVLQDSKPNLVFVILESWTANAIGCLSPTKGATPNFDRLAKNGVLFSNIYATNTTSEIGNTSILAGYPGIPEVAISLYPEKHRKIKSINQVLKTKGYTSSYLFSGDLKYGNIQSFIVEHGFDNVLDENNFPSGLSRGKLNYFDKDLYSFFLKQINASKEPFMQCAFTGSTHPPYDYPKRGKQKFNGAEADFMNSVVYADKCLGDFLKKAKRQKWYKNTVFVFVADHSHGSPAVEMPYTTSFFRIPILLYGEPILKAARGKVVTNIGSQADLAATLMHQLRLPNEQFPFSKDLLSPNVKQFAFHATIRGYGFIAPEGSLLYNFDSKTYVENTISKHDFKKAKLQSESLFLSYFRHFDGLDRKRKGE
jgi:phosphoglycerol transferase MdoB-like AlkP superfamily enzyme